MPLRALLTQLNQDPVYTECCRVYAEKPKAHAWLVGLWGSAAAFFWSGIRERLRRPMLLITPTLDEARALYDHLRLFLEHPDPEREELYLFPSREILPYEKALTDMEIEGERLEVLLRLARGENLVVVAAMEQARERLPDPVWLLERTMTLARGQHVDLDKLMRDLIQMGYVREAMVEARGEFAIRGGIVDLFPPAELDPIRMEFAGTEIFSIRRFQLSPTETITSTLVDQVEITPARLFSPDSEEIKQGLDRWERQQGREIVRSLREQLDENAFQPGMENILGAFVPIGELLDYCPPQTMIILDSPGSAAKQAEAEDVRNQRLYQERVVREPWLPKPGEQFCPLLDWGKRLPDWACIQTGRLKQSVWPESESLPEWQVVIKGTSPMHGDLDLLTREVLALHQQGLSVQVVANNAAEEKRIRRMLAERAANLAAPDLLGHLSFHLGFLNEGFQYPACRLAVFTDQEMFNRHLGRPKPRRQKGQSYPSQAVANLLELKPGDLAVHRDHGVGQYLGVRRINIDGGEKEFLTLAYAGEEKLYVPTDQLHLVERYIGSGDHQPRINRLGTATWERTKQKIKESVTQLARQLLDIYAARRVQTAHAFAPDSSLQREFEEAFPYEETPDQIRAIEEVKRDMESNQPMDRLVCGDVGFGKTEVAMRAAFKAVQDGFQVAVLVPTTILADQHYATFRERMAAYPVKLALLSRFRTAIEQRASIQEIAQGKVDIVIGTHRLLAKDMKFQNLGLIILDEEQHFGVAQKENLKKMRSTVDVLAMTATPIPRTLYLSLSGIRDISIIETPPLNRLPIRTAVMEYSESVIREAVLREMARGGQVFFIHNRVQTIWPMAERIKKIVPEARVTVAHGQMTRETLEPVMEKFLARAEDILVSTTIVESGLDMPNVNTIIINRADALGVSQLYQLRGRVGRADRQAYAYLFYPLGGTVTADAEKRLSTLQEFTELGSGIKIAMRDLEIRGAGDVLGPEQSGQVTAVGFETYCSLLEEAVKELRGQQTETPQEVKISITQDAFLPADYVPDTTARLNLYKRMSGAKNAKELKTLQQEIEARFGTLPMPVQNLLAVSELRLLARNARLQEVQVLPWGVRVLWPKRFRPSDRLTEKLMADATRRLRFLPGEQPGLEVSLPSAEGWQGIKKFLSELNSV